MRSKRVAIIVTQLEAGGAQVAALRLAGGLRSRGFDVQTWFFYEKRRVFQEVHGVRTILSHSPRGPVDLGRIGVRLIRWMRQYRPDSVVTFTHYANVLGQGAATILGVPRRIASQRNPSWSVPRGARLLDCLMGTLGAYGTNIAVSHATAGSFSRYPQPYRRRLTVVHNGIEFQQSALKREEARAHFDLPASSSLIVNIGRLAAQKNQALLLKALEQLPSVHLAIAGEGELRYELNELAVNLGVSDRVHFLGERSRSDIPILLRAADLFAMPSLFEGMSNALLEALSAGVPVISSDDPPQAEVLCPSEQEEVGLLLPPNDVDAWVRAMASILSDAKLRRSLVDRSRKRALEFTVSRMIEGFEREIMRCP